MSGLELNADKTELMPFRSSNVTRPIQAPNVSYCQQNYPLNLSNQIKINGILLQQQGHQMIESNVEAAMRRIDEQLRKWSRRSLSILGKILIVKTFGISQIIYLLQSMSVPESFIKRINAILYKFIWNRHYLAAKAPERIKREIVNKSLKLGGLGMLDVTALDSGIKLKALGRMLVTNHPMLSLLKSKLVLEDFFYPKSPIKLDPVSVEGIALLKNARQGLWGIDDLAGKAWYINAIKKVKLANCLNQNGKNSLAYLMIRQQGKTGLGDLTNPEIRRISPFINNRLFNTALSVERLPETNTPLDLGSYIIKTKPVPLHKLTSKEIRLARQDPEPICLFKIGLIMTPNVSINWANSISRLTSTRHKDILLRLTHGELYSKERLNRYGLVNDPQCPRCNEVETLRHKYLECEYVTEIWRRALLLTSKLRTINDPNESWEDKIFCATPDANSIVLTVHAEIILKIRQLKEDTNYLIHPRVMVNSAIKGLIINETKRDIKRQISDLLT